MKTLHLIANAHIDPVWLWEWEEGAAAALSTFRQAAELAEEFDYIFCHNEALLYRWTEQYDPELFQHIQKLAQQGKWKIMGGWYLQPDCNLSSGESIVRQIMTGRRYFLEKFNAVPTTAVNVDPFGHSRGIVQIMKKCGYDSYLFCRPYPEQMHLDNDSFRWLGLDGSEILCYRAQMGYLSLLGTSVNKINDYLTRYGDNEVGLVMWGVGNHGGGPSRVDLTEIGEKIQQDRDSISIRHSTPEDYFREAPYPTQLVEHSLYPSMVGCYSSQVRVKQGHRQLENQYYAAEKMSVSAWMAGAMKYPSDELNSALEDLMLIEFHDILPGSSIKPAEDTALQTLGHGLETVNRIRAQAFFALCGGKPKAKNGEYPIFVYNPHPYPVRQVVECELQLENQNWEDDWTLVDIHDEQGILPSQVIQENSNMNLDWRKRVLFDCELKPGSISRFEAVPRRVEKKPVPARTEGDICLDNGKFRLTVNHKTGLIDEFSINGKRITRSGAFAPTVLKDNEDPWGSSSEQMIRLGTPEGVFRLMNRVELSAFWGHSCETQSPVQITEDGDVATIVEANFTYQCSDINARYVVYRNQEYFDIHYTVYWNERNKALKISIPTAFQGTFVGEVPYGSETLPHLGQEVSFQKWCAFSGQADSLAILNDGCYAGSCEDGTIQLTLLRSPCYSALPINDRSIARQDAFLPHIDQGERRFSFRIWAGKTEILNRTPALAQQFNEKPYALCLFPSGRDKPSDWFLELTHDEILLTACKKSADGSVILRLFNSSPEPITTELLISQDGVREKISFGRYEIRTVRLADGTISYPSMLEI